MKVAFDIDDTICDMHEPWLGRINKEHGTKWTSEDLTRWDFDKDLGLSEAEILKHLVPELYHDAKPFSEALAIVNATRQLGNEIVYISSCPDNKHWMAKMDWLARFGFFANRDQAFPVGRWAAYTSKQDVGEAFDVDVLVDDSIANCEQWGRIAYLLTRPHNRNHVYHGKRLKKLSDLLTELKYLTPKLALQSVGLQADSKGWIQPKYETDESLPKDVVVLKDGYDNEVGRIINVQPGNTLQPSDKPSNPKDIIGSDKMPLHLWPETATLYGTLGMLEGALKYGRNNFRAVGVRATIYTDAARRHLNAFAAGEDNAADSGLPHLGHALACIAILVEAIAQENLEDDRDYRGEAYLKLLEKVTPNVRRLKDKYADKMPKHYTIKDSA